MGEDFAILAKNVLTQY